MDYQDEPTKDMFQKDCAGRMINVLYLEVADKYQKVLHWPLK
jgi:hypothetical protein